MTNMATVLLFVAMLNTPASAHPMGPDSYNQYNAITVHSNRIDVFHITDLAEFPTYSIIKNEISTSHSKTWTNTELDAYRKRICLKLAEDLTLYVDDEQRKMNVASCSVRILESKYNPLPPGRARDLRAIERRRIPWYTIWIELKLSAPFSVKPGRNHKAVFKDSNFARMGAGWKEIELLDSDSGRITAGRDSLSRIHSGRLNQDKLTNLMLKINRSEIPCDSSVEFRYEAGAGERTGPAAATRVKGGWLGRAAASLPGLPDLLNSGYFIPAALMLAFVLGCLHALSPGHGKTLVAAYLIGSKGRVSDAFFLGIVVTVSHVLSVVALGVVIMLATSGIDNRRIEELLQFGSGLLILIIGLWMFTRRNSGHTHDHSHAHPHDHGHEHAHPHEHHSEHEHYHRHDNERAGWWSILALGVTGGIVPCPTALIVLFSAVAINRIGFGLALICVFSAGLASVLIAVGVLMVKAKGFMDKHLKESGAIRILPYISAAIITAIGVAFITRAAHALGWL